MHDLRFELEQEVGVEVVIFGHGQLVPGEGPDRVQVLPQAQRLDMDHIAVRAMEAPAVDVALGAAIVRQAHVPGQLQIFLGFGCRHPSVPPSCDHKANVLLPDAPLQPSSAIEMNRARVVTLNAALGPLDYRVPDGMAVEPGSIVVAPLGPRQLLGVAWEAERLPSNEIPDSRLRPLNAVLGVPPIAAPLRRLAEWTADYYLAPLASVLRMVLPSSAALEGSRQLIEYRPTGLVPDRLTPQREKAQHHAQ